MTLRGDVRRPSRRGSRPDYKAVKPWEAAVKEAGTLHDTYIAQARKGKFEVVENLCIIDPKEEGRRSPRTGFVSAGPSVSGSAAQSRVTRAA